MCRFINDYLTLIVPVWYIYLCTHMISCLHTYDEGIIEPLELFRELLPQLACVEYCYKLVKNQSWITYMLFGIASVVGELTPAG